MHLRASTAHLTHRHMKKGLRAARQKARGGWMCASIQQPTGCTAQGICAQGTFIERVPHC